MYIEIDDQKIDYSLIRRRGMKSIRMKINEDGMLVVSAPYGVSKAYIEELIRKNAATLSQGKKQSDEAHKRWEDFVHEKMKDVPDWTIKQYGDDIVAGKPFEAGSIYNGLPIVTTQIAFQNMFWDAYKKFNKDHPIFVTGVTIRKMKSRWGSCRPTAGKMTFNVLLLYVPEECARYVIYHELCHYLELNHSARFWAHVAEYVPDYKRIEKEMNKYGRILIDHSL
ncbi:MAG: M48 family metallopeptidase [Lachnospiraceae bacterium]|nr:M48 family metallopeptidase [Lachnospiraceae bacterium]